MPRDGEARSLVESNELTAKKASGKYQRDGAAKLYMYLMESGAKKYAKEFGGERNKLFPKADRESAAREFVREFETEYANGQYAAHVPKKYQPKPAPRRR